MTLRTVSRTIYANITKVCVGVCAHTCIYLPPFLHRYSVVGFIDKNKDTLFQDFKRLLYNR